MRMRVYYLHLTHVIGALLLLVESWCTVTVPWSASIRLGGRPLLVGYTIRT